MVHLSTSQQAILRLLRRSGELTVDDLANAMGISAVAVRQHLEPLLADGYLAKREQKRPIGRPRHLYRLTEAADDLFAKGYATLATTILEYLQSVDGPRKLEEVFRHRRARQEAAARPHLQGKNLEERVAELARIQDEAGYMTDWDKVGEDTFVLREHNCAICRIARQFPQPCQQELEMFRSLLDAEVERTHHLGSGDSMCCYLIRARRSSPPLLRSACETITRS